MQKQEHFERYTPKFPLPADIQGMSQQDTVCQFCGVSYLIHNEIKRLEEKCQKLEADLVYYSGISSRETALEQMLQKERSKISDLESNLNIKTHQFNEISRRLQLMEDEMVQSENSYKNSLLKFTTKLRSMCSQMKTIRNEYNLMKESYSKDNLNWKTHFRNTLDKVNLEIQSIINKFSLKILDQQAQIEHYEGTLKQINQSYKNLQMNHQQFQFESNDSQKIIQNELETARNEMKLQENEINHLHEQISLLNQTKRQLENELVEGKENLEILQKQLFDRDESKKNTDLRLDQYRQQIENEKELRLKSDFELENIRQTLSQIHFEKKEIETNELNVRKKFDDMNRTRQAVLDRTRDEYEKLLRKYTDLDEVYREIVDLKEKDNLELKKIRSELERLHDENIELNKQNETLKITHDVQIRKLHDTYTIKIREIEQWPDRLQTELNREREHNKIQMDEFERQLKESFITELNIEKQKYNALLRKYEHDSEHSTEQLRKELMSTEKVTIEHRQYYTKQIEKLEKDKEDLKKELDTLRDVLKDLHEQLNKKQSTDHEQLSILQLKEDLLAKQTSLFQAQTTINELEQALEQTREEITTLQETVHRECTEREQLKDALIDARQQLLALKKNGILNGTATRSLHSPPIAFEEIEKRVSEPIVSNRNPKRNKVLLIRSEPTTRDSSIPSEAADLVAKPLPKNQTVAYRTNGLPPIRSQPQQQQRSNGNGPLQHRSEQLLENQRRIARFIKNMK